MKQALEPSISPRPVDPVQVSLTSFFVSFLPFRLRFEIHGSQLRENQRPTILLAMLPARLLVPKALPARLEAWLNLSQREKARVFIMVRTRAMTVGDMLVFPSSYSFQIDFCSLSLSLSRSRRWEDDR